VRAKAEAYEDVGMLTIRAGLDAARLPLAAKTIIQELKKIRKNGVTAAELKAAKENVQGGLKLALEDSSVRAEFYGRQELFLNEAKTPDVLVDEFKKVTRSQIQRVAKDVINFRKMSVAAIGPYKTDAALLKNFPVLS
jgi:predicted Zn-dependent peptidase